MKKVKLLITALLLTFAQFASAGDFTVGNKTFLLNGEPFVVKAAEVHYPRIPVHIGSIASKCVRL